jgi:hypothetical protein
MDTGASGLTHAVKLTGVFFLAYHAAVLIEEAAHAGTVVARN